MSINEAVLNDRRVSYRATDETKVTENTYVTNEKIVTRVV